MSKFIGHAYFFDGSSEKKHLSLKSAAELVASGSADAIVLDVLPESEAESFWQQNTSSEPESNQHHSLLSASGVTMGQLQREIGKNFIFKFASYIANSSIENRHHERTGFIKLFRDGLDAQPYLLSSKAEMLIATKRVYKKNISEKFNFLPHVDNISFARAKELWPVEDPEAQLGAFFLVEGSENDAPFLVWDKVVDSRAELDNLATKFGSDDFSDLEGLRNIKLSPRPGQLTIFSSKHLHAVGQCASQRRTIGTFLVPKDNRWFLCH